MPDKFTTVLWFDGDAEDAAQFYAATFPDSALGTIFRAPADFPGGKQGDALTVAFTVMGRSFSGLNGGDMFKPNESVSFMIVTEDQAEPTATGTRSSMAAARRARAAGARTSGASAGRSPRARCSNRSRRAARKRAARSRR